MVWQSEVWGYLCLLHLASSCVAVCSNDVFMQKVHCQSAFFDSIDGLGCVKVALDLHDLCMLQLVKQPSIDNSQATGMLSEYDRRLQHLLQDQTDRSRCSECSKLEPSTSLRANLACPLPAVVRCMIHTAKPALAQ